MQATHAKSSSPRAEDQDQSKTLLCAVLTDENIALVRVVGRGSFSNSIALKRFATHVQNQPGETQLVIDLQFCEAMDSTFMGVLAGIALSRLQSKSPRIIAVNASEHCKRLMKNLGLLQLLELREGRMKELDEAEDDLRPTAVDNVSKLDQLCLTLQAHKELVKLDEENEVRFQAVIEYLEKSLEEEGGCSTNGNGNGKGH